MGSERFGLWIEGRATAAEGDAMADVMEPATGELLAHVAQATVGDAQRAADAAQRAFRSGPWPRARAVERAKALRALAARIREQAKALATLEARNAGKPIGDAEWEVEAAAQCFEFFAGAATTLSGRVPPVDGTGLSARAAPTDRTVRADRSVELPAADRRLEGGARRSPPGTPSC